jgi:tryptophan synthase alpha subunit
MVCICVHNHADGIDVGVYESVEAANKAFANIIRKFFWDEVKSWGEHGFEGLIVPDSPPEDDAKCVEIYNEIMSEAGGDSMASVSIELHEVKTLEEVVNA